MARFPLNQGGVSIDPSPKATSSGATGSSKYTLEQYGGVVGQYCDTAYASFLTAVVGVTTGVPQLELGSGTYKFANPMIISRTLILSGQGGIWNPSTSLLFDDGIPGIIINYATGVPNGTGGTFSGEYVTLRGFSCAAAARTNKQAHGITIRNTCYAQDVESKGWGGDGWNVDANINFGANATANFFLNPQAVSCDTGFYVAGGNASASTMINPVTHSTDHWGLIDTTNIANAYVGGSMQSTAQRHATAGDDRSGGGWSTGYVERAILAKNVLVGDTTVAMLAPAALPATGIIYLDNETISYTGIARNVGATNIPTCTGGVYSVTYDNLTGCVRGTAGTTAAAHNVQPFANPAIITYIHWPQGMDYPVTAGYANHALINPYTEADYSLQTRWTGAVFATSGNDVFGPWVKRATLLTNMLAGDTTATLKSTYGLPTSATILIDSEQMSYTGVTATTLTGLTRGINQTVAAGHTADNPPGVQWPLLTTNGNYVTPTRFIDGTNYTNSTWSHPTDPAQSKVELRVGNGNFPYQSGIRLSTNLANSAYRIQAPSGGAQQGTFVVQQTNRGGATGDTNLEPILMNFDATGTLVFPAAFKMSVTPALGKVLTSDAAGVATWGAGVIENVNTVAASGAAVTLPDVTVDTIHAVTLTANCTFTFPAAAVGKGFRVALKQDATGSRTATWPVTVKWPGAAAPTLTATAAKTDLLRFVCVDGTNWLGVTSGQNL